METRESMLEKLVAKAEEDSDFRSQLLTDPSTALKEAFGLEVPDEFKVTVHQDDARTAHLVLPASAELTDAQLQQAAGGTTCFNLEANDWLG